MTSDRILRILRPGAALPTTPDADTGPIPRVVADGPSVTRAPCRDDLSRPTALRPDWRDRLLEDVFTDGPMRALARSIVERIARIGDERLSPAVSALLVDAQAVALAYLARAEPK